MGPGWSLSGDTDTQGAGVLGSIPIKALWSAGYNVLTWDPRGFGKSGGEAEVDSPAYEARDVSCPHRLGGDPTRGRARCARRPPDGNGRGLIRRWDPAGHGGDRLPDRRHRPHHRLALAGHQLGQGRHGQGGMGQSSGQPGLLRPRGPRGEGEPDVGECHRHHHPGRAPVVCGTGPRRSGLPHPHTDTHRPGHRRHPLHPAGGGGELRDPAQERGADSHDLVLRGPRRVPDPSGQPGASRHRHHRLVEPVREAGHVGRHRPRLPIRRPERHQLLRQWLPRPHRRSPAC